MPKIRSTADRFDLLLDWLNDDDWERSERSWREELPTRLATFLASFDGSEGAGYVQVEELPPLLTGEVVSFDGVDIPLVERLPDHPSTAGIDEDAVLHALLVDLLQRGFPSPEPFLPELLDLPSLRFGIGRQAPLSGKARDRQLFEKRGGGYVLRVAGERFALVPWLVMHLLTLPGAVRLRRCDAPRPGSAERCGKFFVIPTNQQGRPKDFCDGTCRQRAFWERDEKERRGRGAAKRRKRRRRN